MFNLAYLNMHVTTFVVIPLILLFYIFGDDSTALKRKKEET